MSEQTIFDVLYFNGEPFPQSDVKAIKVNFDLAWWNQGYGRKHMD
jgi:hypothetical protein